MSANSKIEWTDASWNSVFGCTKVSPGCKHCYAENLAKRFRGPNGFDPRLVPERLADPIKWATPKLIFVNSMSDLFHSVVTDEYLRRVADVMCLADWHTYQTLTKRSERMRDFLNSHEWIARLPHAWWGVSVEDRKYGIPRIRHLQETRVKTRFLSIEPLLEDLGDLDLRGISWVIVGGESGAGSRPMAAAWVRSIREQCRDAGIPFFFKQWGGVRKSQTGRELDGRFHDGMPVRSAAAVPSREVRQARISLV